jgi:hypothetical protein
VAQRSPPTVQTQPFMAKIRAAVGALLPAFGRAAALSRFLDELPSLQL